MDDVWYVIGLLKEELKEHNATVKRNLHYIKLLNPTLPFFACPNHFLDKEYQRDIQRYIYCKKMGVPPFEGSFGKHPKKWIDKCNVVEKMLNYIQSEQYNKVN